MTISGRRQAVHQCGQPRLLTRAVKRVYYGLTVTGNRAIVTATSPCASGSGAIDPRDRESFQMRQQNLQAERNSLKIAFLGNFGKRNLGNEGTLRAILSNLQARLPRASMHCVSTSPETTAALFDIHTIPIDPSFIERSLLQGSPSARLLRRILIEIPIGIYRWIWTINALRNTDILILPGTQFLSDNLTGPWGWPYFAFRWCIAAALVRCKILFVSVGAGPLDHRLSRFFAKSCLRLASFRSYRDQSSKQYMRNIGFDRPNDPIYPDLAFGLPMPVSPQRTASEDRALTVAVGVKDHYGQYGPWPPKLSAEETYRRYIARMSEFVAWLLERGHTVRLVIGDVSFDAQAVEDLRQALQKMAIRYDSRQLVDDPIDSMDALINRLSTTDIVISPRFHTILFGLTLHKPVLALSYHDKFTKLLESVDLHGFDLPIDNADCATLIERFSELEKRRDELARKLSASVDRQRAALEKQYDAIIQQMPPRARHG